jgi:hypothetical protein
MSVNKQILYAIVFNSYVWPTGQNLSVYNPLFHNVVISSYSHTALDMCEYQFSVVLVPNFLHIK